MRAVASVVVLLVGEMLSSFTVAFAQTPAPGVSPPPLPAPPSDAGAPGETESDVVPIVVLSDRPADAGQPRQPAQSAPPAPPPPQLDCRRRYLHDGFYAGIASGVGELVVWGDGPAGSASISGMASGGTIAVGGSPIPGFAVAGVIGAMTTGGVTFHGGPLVTATRTLGGVQGMPMTLSGHASADTFLLGVLVDWFPVASGGWHVGGIVALGGASITDDSGSTMAGASIGGSVFGGYQWWLAPSWSIGLSLAVMGAPTLNLTDTNGNDTGYKMAPFSAALGGRLLYY